MRSLEERAEHEIELIENDESLTEDEKRREINSVMRELRQIRHDEY